MALQSIGVAPIAPTEFLTPEQDELNKNAFIHRELAEAVRNGRSYEDGLAGLIAQSLEEGPVTGEPRWRRRWTTGTGRVVEFKSFAAFVESADGLATNQDHLLALLEISKNPEVARLSDQVRQELKLPQGTRTDLADNIREVTAAAEVHQQESGTSAAGVRRKIRNWIQQNPQAPNTEVAKQWLATLECNPRSRLHQQALREIGIGKTKRVLDVSSVSEPLIERLYGLAKAEEMTVAEVLEDALAVYFRMDDEAPSSLQEPAVTAERDQPAPIAASTNGCSRIEPQDPTTLPPPGRYGNTALAKALGLSVKGVNNAVTAAPEGGEILRRCLADAPIRVFVHKTAPRSERCEVRPR